MVIILPFRLNGRYSGVASDIFHVFNTENSRRQNGQGNATIVFLISKHYT